MAFLTFAEAKVASPHLLGASWADNYLNSFVIDCFLDLI